MTKTCIIHIGMPKTGTTSLQKALFSAREDLLKNDVNYFSFSENHNALATAFGRGKGKNKGNPGLIKADESLSAIKIALVEAVKNNVSPKFIISAESLGMITPAGVEDMHNLLDPFFDDFVISCYVREPFGFARSAAQQLLKAGSTSEKLISNTLNNDQPGWGNVLPKYRKRLESYVKVFGKERVIVREFDREKLKNRDILDDFLFEAVDYKGATSIFKRVKTNTSLSATLGNMYDVLNHEVPVMIDGEKNASRSLSLTLKIKSFLKDRESKAPYVLFDLDLDKYLEKISGDIEWLQSEFDINFDLRKPNWAKPDIDLSELASLINFLSTLVDNARAKMLEEKTGRMKAQARFEEERDKRQLLQHSVKILRGHGDVEDYKLVTARLSNLPFLEENLKVLEDAGHGVYCEILRHRIEALQQENTHI